MMKYDFLKWKIEVKRKLLYSLIPILLIACLTFIGCRNDGIADALTKAQLWNDRAMDGANYLEELIEELDISEEPTWEEWASLRDGVSDIQAEIGEVKFYLEILKEKYFEEEKY